MDSLHCFFYNAYSQCMDGSIFDGLKMDLITFTEKLLDSNYPDEQIIGERILEELIKDKSFTANTLRKIENSTLVIERQIEILNWKDPAEEDIRCSASEIVSKLASSKDHAIRVATIPGEMESIASLLQTGGESSDGRPYQASLMANEVDKKDYEFSTFNLLGLLILNHLAMDQDNCWKIGNAQGLLVQIIDLTSYAVVIQL